MTYFHNNRLDVGQPFCVETFNGVVSSAVIMVKIVKAIEGMCPQLGSCACVSSEKYKIMTEDEPESEEIRYILL